MPIPIRLRDLSPSREPSVSSRALYSIYRSDQTVSFGPQGNLRTPLYYSDMPSSIEKQIQKAHKDSKGGKQNTSTSPQHKPRTSHGPKNIILQKRIKNITQQVSHEPSLINTQTTFNYNDVANSAGTETI